MDKKFRERHPSEIQEKFSQLKNLSQNIQSSQDIIDGLGIRHYQQLGKKYYEKFTDKNELKKFLEPKKILQMVQLIQQGYNKFLLEKVQLYQQSLQNLLEGKREVMNDEQFVLKDGETVKEKMDKLENYMKSKMPKFRKNKIQ